MPGSAYIFGGGEVGSRNFGTHIASIISVPITRSYCLCAVGLRKLVFVFEKKLDINAHLRASKSSGAVLTLAVRLLVLFRMYMPALSVVTIPRTEWNGIDTQAK